MTDYGKLKYLHKQIDSLHHNNSFSKYIINTREVLEDMMLVLEELKKSYEGKTKTKCPVCGEPCDYIEERYSFGVYAGMFCDECCKSYRDHCGIDQPQGSPNDLDEPYYED